MRPLLFRFFPRWHCRSSLWECIVTATLISSKPTRLAGPWFQAVMAVGLSGPSLPTCHTASTHLELRSWTANAHNVCAVRSRPQIWYSWYCNPAARLPHPELKTLIVQLVVAGLRLACNSASLRAVDKHRTRRSLSGP